MKDISDGILINKPIVNDAVNNHFELLPNIDSKYGPFDSIQEALESIPIYLRSIGLTVGIIEEKDNLDFDSSKPEDPKTNPKKIKVIEEYWWKKGINDEDLVKKGGGGKAIEISYDDVYEQLSEDNKNVQKAIDKLMGKVFYVLPSIRFTNITNLIAEIGTTLNINSPVTWSFGGGTGNITGQTYHIGSNTAVTETNSFDKLTTLQEHSTEITTNKTFSVRLKYNDANGKPQLNISTTVSYNFYSKWFYANISSKKNIPTTEETIRALMTNPPYTYTKSFSTAEKTVVNTFVVAIPNDMQIVNAKTSNFENITSSDDGKGGFCKYTWTENNNIKDTVRFDNGIDYNVYFYSPDYEGDFTITVIIN